VGYLHHNTQAITPNIDKLAARGVAFTHSYCAAPVCNASRAALMTGLRPSTTGVYDNNNDWRKVVSEDLPLTTTFRKAGYYICGSGKIYHEAFERRSEWDDYLEKETKDPKPTKDQSDGVGGIKFAPLDCKDEDMQDFHIVNYGIEQLSKPHDKPLFLAVGLHKPHMPWNVPQKYYDLHPLDKIELPPYQKDDLTDVPPAGIKMANPEGDHAKMVESGRWKEAVQGYLAAASFGDAMIGRLLDALDKSAYKDNTIIVFWCDHGWSLGEKDHWRKFALWENTTRSPLLWSVPGLTKPNSVCDRTVDFMSIYPTLCELCDIPIPKHVEGPSITSLLADPKSAWDKPALTTFHYNNHAVRDEEWRYIRYANGDEELYNEKQDPEEWKNLAGDSNYSEKKETLAKSFPTLNQDDMNSRTSGAAKKPGKRKKRAGAE
jgi:arylsulfatase A-like enzyme